MKRSRTSPKSLSTPPYSKLALVYDAMMTHVNYPRWAQYIQAVLFRQKLPQITPFLDVGCGTGKFLAELQKLGIAADGCDASTEMLEIAQTRLPGTTFFHSSLPDLTEIPNKHYRVITCLYDTINYLPGETTVAQALQSIYQKLKAPGVLIFDAVSKYNCQYYFHNFTDSEVINDNLSYFRESFFDAEAAIQHNRIRIYYDQQVFEENHFQKIYDFEVLQEIIQTQTKFKLDKCYEEFSLSRVGKRASRAHFVLRKEPTETSESDQ